MSNMSIELKQLKLPKASSSPDEERLGNVSLENQDIVTWDSEHDHQNPYNWPKWQKWAIVSIVSLQGSITPIAASILSSGAFAVGKHFGISDTRIITLPVALFVFGLGIGSLFTGPLSELYGRKIVYLGAFAVFTALSLGCMFSPNITVLIVLRFFAGVAGSASSSLGGGTIGDLFMKDQRGTAQSIYGFCPNFALVIGAIVGSFIAERGFQWLTGAIVLVSGLTLIISVFALQETYGPYILYQKAKSLRKETGNQGLRPEVELDPKGALTKTLIRPLRLLFTSPICTFMSFYVALIYSILYLHMVTVPLIFGKKTHHGLFSYHWDSGRSGLAYIGGGCGVIVGTIFCAFTLGRVYNWMTERYGKPKEDSDNAGGVVEEVSGEGNLTKKEGRPEFWMPMMQFGMAIVPIGLVIFAWTTEKSTELQPVPWPVPLLGAVIFCFGMLLTYVCIQTYIVDTFGEFSASALGAGILVRSISGALLSFVGIGLYEKLGYGWGTMVLAFIATFFMPVPTLLYFFGENLRAMTIVLR